MNDKFRDIMETALSKGITPEIIKEVIKELELMLVVDRFTVKSNVEVNTEKIDDMREILENYRTKQLNLPDKESSITLKLGRSLF